MKIKWKHKIDVSIMWITRVRKINGFDLFVMILIPMLFNLVKIILRFSL